MRSYGTNPRRANTDIRPHKPIRSRVSTLPTPVFVDGLCPYGNARLGRLHRQRRMVGRWL